MIDTMKITVTTPTLTPRIVNVERSLLARNVSSAMIADSLMSSNRISLFGAKRLYRIQFSRAPRGPQAADNSHHRRNTDAQTRRSDTDQQRNPDQRRNDIRESKASSHADRSANRGHRHRLDQKLRQNIFPARADCFANADFFGPFRHRHQHDVHHHDAAHYQRERRHADRYDVNV